MMWIVTEQSTEVCSLNRYVSCLLKPRYSDLRDILYSHIDDPTNAFRTQDETYLSTLCMCVFLFSLWTRKCDNCCCIATWGRWTSRQSFWAVFGLLAFTFAVVARQSICLSVSRLQRSCSHRWPNVTILDLSKSISRKRCKIGGKLLLITNRKSHMSFRLVLKSMTANDLETRNSRYIALFRWIW